MKCRILKIGLLLQAIIEDMAKRKEIRKSMAEFLIFQMEGKEQ